MEVTRNTATNCRNLIQRTGTFSSQMSSETLSDLASTGHSLAYPPGTVLFSEKDPSGSILLVVHGEVKLSMNSSDGRRLSLCIARQGEILGLPSALSGAPYEMTAETLHPSKIAHIGRREFFAYLALHPEVHQMLMGQLVRQYNMACEQLRTVCLSSSAPEKLARLLLDWSETGQTTEAGTRFRFTLTHEEIGEFIGTSRETVTRTLSAFKNRRLVTFHGSTLTIPNKTALASFAHC